MTRTEEEIERERQRRYTQLNQEWSTVNSALLGRHRELPFYQKEELKSRGLDLVRLVAAIVPPIVIDRVPSSEDIKAFEDCIAEVSNLSGRLDIVLEAMRTSVNGVNGHVSDSGEDGPGHGAAT